MPSTSPLKNIIIIGAGGHLGPYVLRALTNDPQFNVSILSRNSSTSTFPPGIPIHRVSDDYPGPELLEAFKGQDAVISLVPTASAAQQKPFIDAAINAGVKRFVPSDFGTDSSNDKAVEVLPSFFKGKRDIEEYLRTKEDKGLTWTAFVTGIFFELGITNVVMGFDLRSHTARIVNDGNQAWAATMLDTVGLAVKNAMLVPDKTANQTLYIDSFTVSQNQVLESLEKATGQSWEITHVDANEERKIGEEKMAQGDFFGVLHVLRYIFCVSGFGADYTTYTESANELLGLPKETLDEAINRIVKGIEKV